MNARNELGSRRLHHWRGGERQRNPVFGDPLKENIDELADAIAATIELYNHGGRLTQLGAAGELVPVNMDRFRALLDKHLCSVRVVNGNGIWQRVYAPFGFAHGADTSREPDAKVLDAIYRSELLWRIPKVMA